jgi:chromosome segregation ATPase
MSPEDEFDAAFKEAAAARIGEREPEPDGAAPAAAQPESEDPPQQQPEAEGNKPPEVSVEDLRKKLAEAEHRERSSANRVSAFHRKLNDAEARVKELEGRLQAASAASQPPQQDPDLKAMLEEMPELGKVVEKLVAQRVGEAIDPLQKKAQTVEDSVRPAIEFAEREAIRREIAPVDEAFPGWRGLVFGEDGQLSSDWSSWLESKSPAIRAAYAQVSTAQDAIEFLQMYHRDKNLPLPGARAAEEQPRPAKKPDLAKAVGIPSRPAGAQLNGMPSEDDFDANFNFFAQKRKREAAARR